MSMEQEAFQPIFIVGNSRSGTTLMAKILKCNPDVHVFKELHYFEQLWDGGDDSELAADTARELYAKLKLAAHEGIFTTTSWQHYLREEVDLTSTSSIEGKLTAYDVYRAVLASETRLHDKRRPCEQTPRNVYYLAELLCEFVNARVLIMVRDPRAILLSQKKKWRLKTIERSNRPYPKIERVRCWANYHPLVTSLLWRAAIRAGQRFESDTRVMVVRFEDLVTQPQQTVSGICAFLGLDYDDVMLDVAPSLSPTAEALPHRQNRGGIDPSIAEQWKTGLGASDIYWCERINGERMQQLGYPITGIRPVWLTLVVSLISLPLKSGLAMLLNISKMSNIYQSVRRRFG
ncbi:MAG: sulfotransferase [Candidatus Thiodiazotropha sp. (ex Epidulcina cf. delphinae)]|nr:sulfotransferase [Candidatus Thiodiazotropha sp. (ex Epidulcina cf. delphinae)]